MARSRFGSIKRLGPDHYRLRWSDRGRRKCQHVRCTREEAIAILAHKQAEIGGGVPDMTWSTYWNFAAEPSFEGLAEKTVHGYRRVWRVELEPRIGNKKVSATTWRQAESVLNDIQASSVQRAAFRLWRKICNFAVRDGLLDRNPVDRSIKLKRHVKRKKELIPAEDMGEWLEAIRGSSYEALFLLEVGGGLRHEEACAMVWENVERYDAYGRTYVIARVERGLVMVGGKKELKDVKNEHSRREVVIGDPFASRLLELHLVRGPVRPSVTPYRDGPYTAKHFSTPSAITNNWRNWCDRNGLFYVRPGDMRSVFATLHGEAGTPDSLVSLAMGHADGGSTKARNYQQRTRRGLIVAADSLTDYLLDSMETLR